MPYAGQIYSVFAVLNCSAFANIFVEIVILKIDADTFAQLLIAGLRTAIADREYMNTINVFPVADGDTGTNLAATFGAIVTAIGHPSPESRNLPELLSQVADIAVDNARGNSGAIMAQYFEGLRESTSSKSQLNAVQLAHAFTAAATQARAAMSKPVEGTLPTVLAVFAKSWELAAATENQLIKLFTTAHLAARKGLFKTTEQLTVLRKAGVVDAGAQGFVDVLDGIAAYIENDCQHSHHAEDTHRSEHTAALKNSSPQIPAADSNYRFCTECVVEADPLDRLALHTALESLDCDSLVVAGTLGKARVHLHTNNPAAAFLQCEAFGKVLRQKADDMHRHQHGDQHKVAIVTDSAADLDIDDIDRLNLHVVPVRLILNETEYLDKVSISPVEFAEKLAEENVSAKTSQPPPGDFKRQFELLTSHGHEVVYISLSSKLSGTYQAAQSVVDRLAGTDISLLDSRNLSGGQGLIAMYAAEAAEQGLKREQIMQLCRRIRDRTNTYGLIADLSPAVRGGRIPAYAGWLAKRLGLHPLFKSSPAGELKLYALVVGQKNLYKRFAKRLSKRLSKRLQQDRVYRIVISHCAAFEHAKQVRSILLANHPEINSCQIVDAGSALGVHLGLGGVAVGIQDYQPAIDLLENGGTQ